MTPSKAAPSGPSGPGGSEDGSPKRSGSRHPFPHLPDDFFREEAVEHYQQSRSGSGQLIRVAPLWTQWFYWLLVVLFIGGLTFLTFGSLSEYAEGPAIVRLQGQIELTAKLAGVVNAVEVGPDDAVTPGQPLLNFYDAQEAADLERSRWEFEQQLINWLRNPSDPATRQGLASLRARIDQARSRLNERSLRAPFEGVVSDIRVRPGQPVSAGQVLLSIAREDSSASIVAMLPGHYRPMLETGMPLRIEVAGYAYAYQELRIDSVDDEVIGPGAVRRYLGQDISDTAIPPGPVVLVHATLPGRTFEADNQQYPLHDGMMATAQARVRRQSILYTLVPGLKAVFRSHGN